MKAAEETKRKRFEILRGRLENERAPFLADWRELSEYLDPTTGKFNVGEKKGTRRSNKIIDSTATMALRTLQAGFMASVTSPARRWFRITLPNPQLAEVGSVKTWLEEVSNTMATSFLRSNLYNQLLKLYSDLSKFAIGAIFVQKDMDTVSRYYALPIGSYCVSLNNKGKVDTFFRTFQMTVRQLIEEFGRETPGSDIDWKKFSIRVKQLYDAGNMEQWIEVTHVILPNEEYKPSSPLAKFKKYSSYYYENCSGNFKNYEDVYLKEEGFDYFPVLCPRWATNGEEAYGVDCPGMTVLADVKALQLMQKRKAQAIEKKINPPMVGPLELKTQSPSILPGSVTYLADPVGKSFRTAHEVNFQVGELAQDIQETQDRIRRGCFEDVFRSLLDSDRRQITATEVQVREQEKLLVVGPVLEQLNPDLLEPLIDIQFALLQELGMLPEAPEELQGQELKIEFISIMQAAQKAVDIGGIERFFSFIQNLAAVDQSVLQKVDLDQIVDIYGDRLSVPSSLIRTDDAVKDIRAQIAQAQAQAQQAQQMAEAANAAKTLSQANLEGDSALTRLMNPLNSGAMLQ